MENALIIVIALATVAASWLAVSTGVAVMALAFGALALLAIVHIAAGKIDGE